MKKAISMTAFVLAMALLVGCGDSAEVDESKLVDKKTDTYVLPEWALTVVEPSTVDGPDVNSAAKVDVYYDNTQSMYGFANGGTMVRAVGGLRDVINQYSNTTIYTLDGVNSVLKWQPFEGDLYSSLTDYEGFYTVGKGSFATGTGPLQMLYYEDATLDPGAINVVITDLAEQNVDMSELASKINEDILSQEGYSATLIGIQGDFSGKKYVSDLDAINQMNGTEVNGKVPIYMLITGADAPLGTYTENLLKAFKDYELVEDTDYFVARYHAGNSAKVLQQSDILTVAPAQEEDGVRKKDWSSADINLNLALSEIDASHMDTLIDTDHYLNMFAYRYDNDANGVNTGRTVLNYFLPIERTDGLTLPVQTRIYTEDEKATTSQLQALYDSKEKVTYNELVKEDAEEVGSLEDWRNENPALTGGFEVGDKKGVLKDVYGWEKIKQITYDKDMTITTETIAKGDPVYDMLLDPDGRKADDYYEGTDLGLAANSDLLHISIEFNRKPEERDSDTVLLNIPVYAMAESVENVPDWISGWDSAGTKDYITHTFGLENFFRTLFGLNVLGDADTDRALREVKIADIMTCVTNLPD